MMLHYDLRLIDLTVIIFGIAHFQSYVIAVSRLKTTTKHRTACDLPSPRSDRRSFAGRCRRYVNLPYLCDSDQLLSRTGGDKIDAAITKYSDVFRIRGIGKAPNRLQIGTDDYAKATQCELGIVLLKHFRVPFHNFSHYASPESHTTCFVRASQYVLDNDAFTVLTNESYLETYLSYITASMRRKWFGNDCGNHILLIIVTENVLDSATNQIISNKPYFIVSAGKTAVRRLSQDTIDGLSSLGHSLFWKAISLPEAIERVIYKLGQALIKTAKKKRQRPKHNIPRWAIISFACCFGLITFLVFLDWFIVRRGGLSLRGGGAGKAPGKTGGDRVHTHMWF